MATVIEEISNKEVRENKEKYSYNSHTDFTAPLYLESGKILRPNEKMEEVAGNGINEVIEEAQTVDDNLNHSRVKLEELEIVLIDGIRVWEFKVGGQVYSFEGEVMMKKFSNYIGVPWEFTKKNPSYLTESNFKYHIELTMEKKKKDLIIIYHQTNPLNRLVRTFFPYSGEVDPVKSEIMPLYGSIIRNLGERIQRLSGSGLKVQSYNFGYNGENNGNHFVRLLVDDPKYKMTINGEEYSLGINVLSSFINTKYRGSTSVSVVMFREVCSNGMVVEWNGETKNELATRYAENIYGKLLEGKKVPVKDGMVKIKVLESLRQKFFKMVNTGGLKIQTERLNDGKIEGTILDDILEIFINSKDELSANINRMNENFLNNIEEKDMDFFINSCYNAASDSGLNSRSLVKLFLMEFISTKLKGKNDVFKNGMDVVNFLTFIGKSYNADEQFNIESKAFRFGMKLRSNYIHGRVQSDYEKMKYQILSN